MYCKWCDSDRPEEEFELVKQSKIKRVTTCSACASTLAKPYGKQRLDKSHPKHTTPCMMYFIKISTLDGSIIPVWKVGVTSKLNVANRFSEEGLSKAIISIDVLETWNYNSYFDALDAERKVLDFYEEFYYSGKSPLTKTGTWEMFTKDVLND